MTWSLWKRSQFPEFWGFVVDMIEEVVWLSAMLWNHTTLGPDLGPLSKSYNNVVILGQGLFWASLQPSSADRVKNNTKQTHYTSITRGPVFDDKGENMWMQSCSENLRNQSNTFLWFGLYDSPALWALFFIERLIRVRMFSSYRFISLQHENRKKETSAFEYFFRKQVSPIPYYTWDLIGFPRFTSFFKEPCSQIPL